MPRKPRPERDPGAPEWIRTAAGSPGRLVDTGELNHKLDPLYRIDFGSTMGQNKYSLADIERFGGVVLPDRPADWRKAGEKVDSIDEAFSERAARRAAPIRPVADANGRFPDDFPDDEDPELRDLLR